LDKRINNTKAMMKYNKLGKSDLNISRIGFGCMSLKDNQADNNKIIDCAVDYGINFFDTADLYETGLNEESVGKALKGKREKVIIATKVGNQWRADGSGWDWNPNRDYIISAVEKSLKRLQTDYIDLYQLHGGTMEDPIDETIEAFEQLQKQGKIRYYGISSIRPVVIREFVKKSRIVSVMMQYSLIDRRPEESALPLLLQNNIGVLARGSVASGLLIDKPAKPYLKYTETQVATAAKAIENISGPRSKAQSAIQLVLSNPAITAAVVGIRTMEQLKDAVETLDVEQITETELAALKAAIEINQYTEHR
jgi:aryl-alcohol dehydrogenase-like predicted oxidoreductase